MSTDMKFNLKPDKDLQVQTIRAGKVPTLVVRPAKSPTKRAAKSPAEWSGKCPASDVAVLWIHGGGYITGMKEMVYMGRAVDLVKKYGVTVFSPGYRLAWMKPYPAAVKDCYATLRYINKHRDELGVRSIVVGGESAGGGLAIAVCMLARDHGIKVDYQIPLYPMMSNMDTDSSRDNHAKVWNTPLNHIGWRVYLRGRAKKKVSPYASPAWQTDYSGLPPCYTFVADEEPFYCETLQYVENLKAAGVEAEVDVYHMDSHAFDMLRPEEEESRRAIRKFEEKFEYALEHYCS